MKIFQSKITLSVATFSLIFLLFSSCRSESDANQCFENNTDEPIDLYIDGDYELTISDNGGACIFLGNGCSDWYVEGVDTGDFSEGTVCLENGNFSTTIIIDN